MSFNRNSSFISFRSKAKLNELVEAFFKQDGSAKRLGVDSKKLARFIQEIGKKYRRNFYHNYNHAVDTVNTMGWLLERPTFKKHLNDFDRFLLLISALAHDVDHPGNDNRWEMKSKSEWAQECESSSVIEFHSVELTKDILAKEECDILDGFSATERKEFITNLEELILFTDFAEHGDFVHVFRKHIMDNGKNFSNPAFKRLVRAALLKAADIGNLAKPFPMARRWAYRVMQENWAQGEMEKAAKLPVGPLNDPDNSDFYQAQASFIGDAALKFFRLLYEIEEEMREFVLDMESNRDAYENSVGQKLKSVK